jgi:acyl-[acyl carrier protein]--UDP-N-acetylglucosamine O-acyltransferase
MSDGIMIAANATLNPLVELGRGVICNTSTSIDHECIIGDFCHIAPGAVLCGNVTVGRSTFIGANAVIRQGIHIGNNVMIGAGTVVKIFRSYGDSNPARSLLRNLPVNRWQRKYQQRKFLYNETCGDKYRFFVAGMLFRVPVMWSFLDTLHCLKQYYKQMKQIQFPVRI